jgi:polysaccharide export outer membrane protein
MKSHFFKLLIFTLIITLSSSCNTAKRFNILQKPEKLKEIKKPNYEAVIQPDNLLSITISSIDPKLSLPYNLAVAGGGQNGSNYLVDQEGYIQLAGLGRVKVTGMTRNELADMITALLEGKIENPEIQIRILNFKVTFQGQVGSPGVINFASERITMFEALGMAGDVTPNGRKETILIVREENNTKTFNRVDITKAEFLNSPFYYLNHNDLIYVEPTNVRAITTVIGPSIGLITTSISFILTIVILISR